MAENSKIQWTDHTVNFWYGCRMISRGCYNCYWFRDAYLRYGRDPELFVRSQDSNFFKAYTYHEPAKIFTCSDSDFFHKNADQWRDDAWTVIHNTPHLHWQILTKRPHLIRNRLPHDWGESGWNNVWLGVTVEGNLTHELRRIEILKNIPAAVRFISVEPLIEDIPNLPLEGIDWVIIGGESGNDNGEFLYRPTELEWMLKIKEQCDAAGVPVFVKQLGVYLSKKLNHKKIVKRFNRRFEQELGTRMVKDKNTGLMKEVKNIMKYDREAGDIRFFPPELKVRQFPAHWNQFLADYYSK
ncbi:MAG: DUF5131 family protein [Leptospiraceae bacterium]|nr:DUF5131 family protein [Leptospiraceae bacterium]